MICEFKWDPLDPLFSLREYSRTLPVQSDRAYELSLTRTAETCPQEVFDACRLLLADPLSPLDDRFAALFLLCIHLRRFMSFSEFASVLDEYGSEFASQPLYPHLAALMYSGRGGPGDIEQALELSRIAAANLPGHVGVLHAFAVNVASAAEAGVSVENRIIDEAKRAVAVAIGLEPRYAKFHCTRGRLQAVAGDFSGGRSSIRKAMDLEEESKSDYSLRIGAYQHQLAQVSVAEMQATLEKQVADAEAQVAETGATMLRQVEDLRSQNLTTLGLFTAILSFTLGSLQIAQGQAFEQAASLIIVMAGSIMTVYGLFLLVVRRNLRDTSRPMVALSVLGAAIVIVALVLGQ